MKSTKVDQVIAKLDKKKIPILKPIDLSKAVEHECPGIDEHNGTQYLICKKWQSGSLHFTVGTFGRQWFGLTLGSNQFDAPGYNHSSLEALWEIIY